MQEKINTYRINKYGKSIKGRINMTTFYNNFLIFLMDKSFLLLTCALCLGIFSLIIKLLIKKTSYRRLINLIQNNFRKGMKKLNELEDQQLRKKIITDGKQQLNDRLYHQVKTYLIEEGILRELLDKIKTGNKQERVNACYLLDEFATPEALDYCTIALYDPEEEVRMLALETLVDHPSPKIIDTLIDYYEYCCDQQEQKMKSKLSKSFLQLGSQALYQLTDAALKRGEKYKNWLINLFKQMELSETERRKVGKVLLKLLNDKVTRVRKLAVKNVTNFITNEEVINKLIEKLEDRSPQVRQEALQVLSKLEAPEQKIGSAILKLLQDENKQVRITACRALVDLGPQGIDYLLRASELEEAKETIIQVLDELETSYLVSIVKDLYLDLNKTNNSIEELFNKQSEKCG